MKLERVEFNEEKALQVFRILVDAWKQKTGIFKNAVLPQNLWPLPDDSKEAANFLFFAAIPQRGGITSEPTFDWLYKAWQKFPEVFDPRIVAEYSPDKLKEMLLAAGATAYHLEEHSRHWIHNAQALYAFWEDDVRNVFAGVGDFEEAFALIDHYRHSKAGFRGMRRKIFSLLVIWLQEKDFISRFPTAVPVDFHCLRILLQTEIMKVLDAKPFVPSNEKQPETLRGKLAFRVKEKLVDEVAVWSLGFLKKHSISALDLNPPLWLWSRTFCAGYYPNRLWRSGVDKADLTKNPSRWPKNYWDPCGTCLIQNFCKSTYPQAPHYESGYMVRLGKRILYPQMFLPGIAEKK